MNLSDPQERSAAAAEYILGTLDEADRRDVEAALATDDALRAEVYYWQDRLLGLTTAAPPAELPPDLWKRIEARLPSRAADAPPRAGAAGPTAVGPAPAAAPRDPRGMFAPGALDADEAARARRRADPAANAPRFWQRLAVWRGIAGAAVAATLVMGVLLGQKPETEVRYVAVLQAPDKTALAGWVVEVTPGGKLQLRPTGAGAAYTVPAGRALQFWTKPQGASGPTSLGLVPAGAGKDVPLDRLPGLGEQTLFEITLEPETGSPYDRPSGPVLFIGRALRI